ncbi:MAG: S1 RNA-binding domain-containing protein [Clostridia bacterium]|nr:S1 RNA-binding domain-containing protein [Clostridia bacterium]
MALAVGEIVEGTVTGITRFGAFVELPDGPTGLVHISEVSDSYVEDIHDHLKRGDKVKVKILSIAPDGKRIGLSIRQALPGASEKRPRGGGSGGARRGGRGYRGPLSFEDKLQRFMRDSEDRLSELRHKEDRRGGRGTRGARGF